MEVADMDEAPVPVLLLRRCPPLDFIEEVLHKRDARRRRPNGNN